MQAYNDILGVVGVVIINISYCLLSVGKLKADHWSYSLSNLVGAGLIVYSLIYDWNLSAFLMEASWVLISLYGLIYNLMKKKREGQR